MTEDSLPEFVENPKLTLYAFHLCHDFASAEGQRVGDSDRLWENFAKLGQELAIEPLATCQQWLNLPEHGGTILFRELLSEEIGRCLRFPILPADAKNTSEPRRNGELYALQIHDTYAADLTFRYDGKVSINQLKNLNPQGKLLPDRIQASLGQTLVLFAKPIIKPIIKEDNSPPENWRSFADRCVKNLLAEAAPHWQQNLSYLGEGKLLSSPIFAYETYQNLAENTAESCQIIIWLDCHPDNSKLEADAKYYHPLINLLCCRSKIQFSYHQARTSYRETKALYRELEQQAQELNNLPQDISERLTSLKKSLLQTQPKSFTYASYLRDIQDQRTTIITNFKNYTISLENMQQIEGENDLFFCQTFSNKRSQFLAQIHTDLNYLTPGKILFGQYIETVRGIVEIEQAEINHHEQEANQDLQDHIQAVGVGIAAGAIMASSSGLITQPWSLPSRDRPLLPPHPFIIALVISCLCSVGAWLLAKKVINQRRKKSEKT
jgi:hypothetical protein